MINFLQIRQKAIYRRKAKAGPNLPARPERKPAITPRKTPLTEIVTILLAFLALSLASYPALGSGGNPNNQKKGTAKPAAEAVIPPTGGAVALPDNEVFVSVAPGIVEEPIRVRIEKVTPKDAPGPITEGVTVIKGVKVSLPGYDYSKPYAGNFKGRQLLVAFKPEGFVEEPNLSGDYYTAVCFWDDFEGRGTFGVLTWACSYGAESKIYDIRGERYYFYWLDVVPQRGRYFYLVQYPKELSRKNCEAAGGEFSDPYSVVPMCYFDPDSPYDAEESMGAWIKSQHEQSEP